MTIQCTHPLELEDRREVCAHLLETPEGYITSYRYYTGQGVKFVLICEQCKENPDLIQVHSLCFDCSTEVQDDLVGVFGKPESASRDSDLVFLHQKYTIEDFTPEMVIDIHPLSQEKCREWIALTTFNTIVRVNFDEGTVQTLCNAPQENEETSFTDLHISPNGELAVLYSRLGTKGAVLDLNSGKVLIELQRDGYHSNISPLPIAFFEHRGRSLLIHGGWNRLDISDPKTGELLTARHPTSYKRGEPRPETYLNYFHAELSISPDQQWIADDGWVLHPIGYVRSWSLDEWLRNPWASEKGDSIKSFCYRDYFWSGPTCWIDNRTLAIWGYGEHDILLIPAVRLFDVVSGEEQRWFAGPEVDKTDRPRSMKRDVLVFDTYLYAVSEAYGVQVWDIYEGERVHQDSSFYPVRYHHGTHEFLTLLPSGEFQCSWLVVDAE